MNLYPVTVVLVFAGMLLWGATVTTWLRREAPAAGLFAVVACLAGTGALAIATSVALDLPHPFVLAPAVTVALLLPVPWLLFAFEYTGRDELVSPGVAGSAAVLPGLGLVAVAIIFGSRLLPGLELPSREAASGLVLVGVTSLSMVQWLALLYSGGVMLVGSGIVLLTFHRYEHLDPTAGMLLGVFGTVPWLSLLFGFQVASITPSALSRIVAVGFLIGGTASGIGLGRYHLFRTVPAAGNVGPATVIQELADGVFITDDEGMTVAVNTAAERAMDAPATELVGGDVGELLDTPLEDLRGAEDVELLTDGGRRLFEPTVSELTDHHGYHLGYAIVLRDVTARTTRQQRLEVLNRVLRHNLRNEMTVILGHAKRLGEEIDDPDLADRTRELVRHGQDLVRLSEEAQEIERLMATVETSARTVSLASLVEDILETAGEDHPRVTDEANVPPDIAVEDSELLELALTHLIENAIEHNDSEDPRVEITASYDPGETYPLTVSVADNGPGIPDTEMEVIERGTETQLRHGSGLGLWVVRWAITRLGGEITFECREPRGTIVRLRLPQARRTDAKTKAGSAGARDRR